ncbi:hypothetical protein [Staphylococcus gallinarum]|nr:hypothetical protein [Staphylococcus gallinarum]
MSEVQKLELKYIIENIELELEFQDLTENEIKERKENLKIAKEKLKKIKK